MSLDLEHFERVVVYKCLTDETYLAAIIDYIQPELFRQKNIQAVLPIITDFYKKRGTIPTYTEIKNYLTSSTLKDHFISTISSFSDIDKQFNKDELYSNTETFLKERAVFHTLSKVVDSVGRQNVNTSEIFSQFERACNICLDYDTGLDLLPDINRVCEDLHRVDPCIKTGWKWLDERLGGGFQENGRAMYVFAGETNVGKSIFLSNLAEAIAAQNKCVLIISLEMSEMMYARRVCSKLTNIPIIRLKEESETLKTQIHGYSTKIPGAKILIKEFPPSTVSVNHINAFIKKLTTRNIKPNAIIVDYINLLHSPQGTNSYERVKHSAEQLRALSYIFNCPVITATQINRAGYGIGEPGLQSIAESMALPNTADFMAGIWQDDTDRQLGVIKMSLMKNRFGSNFGTHNMRIDYNTLTVYDDDIASKTDSGLSTLSTLAALDVAKSK